MTDLAQAHALALEVKESGFFNLGIGGGVSVLEVIEACRKITGKKIPMVTQARRPGDPPRLIASAQKAREVLGWRPQYEQIEDIVSSAWSWHLRYPNGYND